MKRILGACLVSLLLVVSAVSAGAFELFERKVPESSAEMTLSFAPVVKKAAPAVVNIYTKRKVQVQSSLSPFMNDPFFQQFFANRPGFGGMTRERVVSSLGSGVIIDADGTLVTSQHVVDKSDEVIAVLSDRREFKAKVVFSDASSDLALLKLELDGQSVPFIPVVDSDAVEVGDLVLAVGNPFGVGQTVTSGIVSALARSAQGVSDYDFFIQTDAAINPGNSGGALVNMQGELIGINTAIYSRSGGSNGIGFAIPSNMVRAVLRNMRGGTVVRPWLGASYQPVTQEVAESLGLARPNGVLVSEVAKDSPADDAGLRAGDVILAIDEVAVNDPQALKFRLHTLPVGEEATLSLLRNGSQITKLVTLESPPEVPLREKTLLKGNHPLSGMEVMNLSPKVAIELNLPVESRGVVLATSGGGLGIGFQVGDIVAQVNGQEITSVKQLVALLARGARQWDMVLRRGQQTMRLQMR